MISVITKYDKKSNLNNPNIQLRYLQRAIKFFIKKTRIQPLR